MDNTIAPASTSLPDHGQARREPNRAMTLNPQQPARELAEKIAALSALYPYYGAVEKKVYLFTPTEAERDLIVQALRAFAVASPPNEMAYLMVSIPEFLTTAPRHLFFTGKGGVGKTSLACASTYS